LSSKPGEDHNTDVVQKRFTAEGEYVLTGTKKYLTLTDHLGSVRDVIDITGTPTLVGSFDYTPYGAVARSWGTVTPGYTYAGLFAHPQTGLLLSATRAYDPAKGRFLNRDPKKELAVGENQFAYTLANPVRWNDPTGLDVWIEGPSFGEPFAHQSICFGYPFGKYVCVSFAINGGGGVYIDKVPGGQIESYLPATLDQTVDALNYVLSKQPEDDKKWYGVNEICRSYSQRYFDEIQKKYELQRSSTPPQRSSVPHDGPFYLRTITVGPVTSTGSSSGSGTFR
jgi:RHS repeat-associated protein